MLLIEPMLAGDVNEVSRLEARCFSNPWPRSAYRRELRNTEQNRYVVLRIDSEANAEWLRPAANGSKNGRMFRLRLPLPQFGRRTGSELHKDMIIGFSGFWQLFDEVHITTIAIDPRLRRRHLGELLLLDMIEAARQRSATFLSLEVRKSNAGAIQLYEKYGFSIRGVRPLYYTDDGEDAFVMRSEDIRSKKYRERLQELRQTLGQRVQNMTALPASADDLLFDSDKSETRE